MTSDLYKTASFHFDHEGGKLVAATRNAAAESTANRDFLSKAVKFGAAASISNSVPLTLQR